MRAYEDVDELKVRLAELQQRLHDGRNMRWKMRSREDGTYGDLEDDHFELFEKLILSEIEQVNFYLELDMLLTV